MTLETAPEIDPGRIPHCGDSAIVVGGSMAGMLAARVLADAFDQVTLLERDAFDAATGARRGIPQSEHIHVMLEAGRATIDDLFPNFSTALRAAGGLELDAAAHMTHFEGGGILEPGTDPLVMYSVSRPVLDDLVRQQLERISSVTVQPETHVSTNLSDASGAVTGVAIAEPDGGMTDLEADLVIDASGRSSRTPKWLEQNGYARPPEQSISIDVTYGSGIIQRPSDDLRGYLVPPAHPRRRGAALVPIEANQWQLTAIGVHGEAPPTDPTALRSYLASLPITDLSDIFDAHGGIDGEITRYRFSGNLRRRYDALQRFPSGLLVIGDALASFNPIYGQGMSVAALEARHLHGCLADGGLDELAPRYFSRTADVIDTVWRITMGSDFRFPQTTGKKPVGTGIFNRYISQIIRTAHDDPVVGNALYSVLRLEREPQLLYSPSILFRIGKHLLTRSR